MKKDVAIVGGGIIGLMTAWQLAQRTNLSIALFEREECGAGATGAAIGGLIPYSFSRSQGVAEVQRQSIQKYPTIAEELRVLTG
ncbi:MAG: FAD-dependent oxidoreductase, partial [Alphaproteobacteria bacterium]|nr:FAD-dependent oxidoreductase [Alphaproteobacteria bacterium]